jgi:hypothetical protein
MAGKPRVTVVALVAVFFMAAAAQAQAATDVTTFSTKLSGSDFGWTQHVGTNPDGSQPDVVSAFTLLVPGPFALNAAVAPTCMQSQVDGQYSVPSDCQNAVVGTGTASILAGSPGSPATNSVRENLTVQLMNGSPAGQSVLLVVNSTPASPIAITNRVVPGTVVAQDPYAFGIRFSIPPDLQQQLGLALTWTDFDVTTSRGFISAASTCATPPSARLVSDFVSKGAPAELTSDAAVTCPAAVVPPPPPTITTPARLGRATVSRSGSVTLNGVTGSCPAGTTQCTLTATARSGRTTVATGNVTFTPGTQPALRLHVTSAGKRLLAKRHRLATTLRLVNTPSGGTAVMKTLALTLAR